MSGGPFPSPYYKAVPPLIPGSEMLQTLQVDTAKIESIIGDALKKPSGLVTLVGGTETVSVPDLTPSDTVFIQMKVPGAGVIGVAHTVVVGTGSFVIQAVDSAGAPVATDVSEHSWMVFKN